MENNLCRTASFLFGYPAKTSGYRISLWCRPEAPFFQKELVMPTNKNMVDKVKAIGVAFLAAAGVAAGAFDKYKLAESPMVLVTLPVNILGIFSMLAVP
jgi:hypothetical protein